MPATTLSLSVQASHNYAALQDCDDWLRQMMRKNEMLGELAVSSVGSYTITSGYLPSQTLTPTSCASHQMLLLLLTICTFVFRKDPLTSDSYSHQWQWLLVEMHQAMPCNTARHGQQLLPGLQQCASWRCEQHMQKRILSGSSCEGGSH